MRFDIESVAATEEETLAVASLEFLGYPCDTFLRRNPRFINHPVIPVRLCGCLDKACRTRPHTEECPNITSEKAEWLTSTNPYYRTRRMPQDSGDALIAVLDECIQDLADAPEEEDYPEIVVESMSLPETPDVPELDGNPTFIHEEENLTEDEELERNGFHVVNEDEENDDS